MEMKKDIWKDVDRIIKDRFLPEKEMERNKPEYENIRLLDDIDRQRSACLNNLNIRAQLLEGYADHLKESIQWNGHDYDPSLDESECSGSHEKYEETIKLTSLSKEEIKTLAINDVADNQRLNAEYFGLKNEVMAAMRHDINFCAYVKENHIEYFDDFVFTKEYRPTELDHLVKLEPLPVQYHNDEKALITYKLGLELLDQTKALDTPEELIQLSKLTNQVDHLLNQLDKPTLSHERQSESDHDMEL